LSAADRTIRADGSRDFGSVVFGFESARFLGHSLMAGAVSASFNLLNQGPTEKQIFQQAAPPNCSAILDVCEQLADAHFIFLIWMWAGAPGRRFCS
jgi:hypothetical protein